jgi:serine phosphatase RsbU (regulator of sigma subunit)/pSer/pThr/pTyr-binding forkhead associated (FHA) protein
MATLLVVTGPRPGEFPLKGDRTRISREPGADIYLPSQLVSRNHAQIVRVGDAFFIEDLGSRNGTFVNGKAITGRVPLTPKDSLQIGEYLLSLDTSAPPPPATVDTDELIREQVQVSLANVSLFSQDATQQLQMVMEITQELGTAQDVQAVLDQLLPRLLRLFPRADRGLILLCEQGRLTVRAQHSRHLGEPDFPYSSTIVKKSLADGIGILCEDVHADARFVESKSLSAGAVRSLLCVPLICKDGRRLGVLQLERLAAATPFELSELRLLSTVALQVAVVLDHAALHAEQVRQQVLLKELAVAREIQAGFLPTDFAVPTGAGVQHFAGIRSAREVSGDLYDFLWLPDGRLALFVGDVSGKGMPAALFMIAVRTLARHLAPGGTSPAQTLARLNTALAADNSTMMFVTLAHGVYDPATGELVLASGGHPPPLLVRTNGEVQEVSLPTGRLLGYPMGKFQLTDTRLTLAVGETLVFYSDGYTEAFAPDGETMFDVDGLKKVFRGCQAVPLSDCAARAQKAVQQFTRGPEVQDDQTLYLLRRV